MRHRTPPYLSREQNITPLFWLLVQIDENGYWRKEALSATHVANISDQVLRIIKDGSSKPNRDKPNELNQVETTACAINAEIAHPGTDDSVGLLLSAATGDLSSVRALAANLVQAGEKVPVHSIAIVAISSRRAPIVQFCLEHDLAVDDEISFAAWRSLHSSVMAVLWPHNILGMLDNGGSTKENEAGDDWVTILLEEASSYGLFETKFGSSPSQNPDAPDMARFLISKGAVVDRHALQAAVLYQTTGYLQVLLDHGGQELARGSGLLHLAAQGADEKMTTFLIEGSGVDVNEFCDDDLYGDADDSEQTLGYALYHAMYNSKQDMAKELLRRGADPRLEIKLVAEGEGDIGSRAVDGYGLLEVMRGWKSISPDDYIRFKELLEDYQAKNRPK